VETRDFCGDCGTLRTKEDRAYTRSGHLCKRCVLKRIRSLGKETQKAQAAALERQKGTDHAAH
jgi:hypothetical protein